MANTPARTPGQMAGDVKQKAQEAGSAVAEKSKDIVSTVTEKAKDMASSVAHTAGNVASTIGHKADDAVSGLGSGMQSLGSTIREKGPDSGILGSATSAVASGMENAGRYLHEEGLSGIGEDLTNLIRRNPIPALLVGIAVGFLVARATRS